MGDCQDTNIPQVNEDALECCEIHETNCIKTSEAVPCLQVGKGETLTKLFQRLCKFLNRFTFLQLFDTPSSYQGNEGNLVAVNQDGTGLEFVTPCCDEELNELITGAVVTQKKVISGEGSPEGVLEAPVGTIYTDELGSAGAVLYVKESGTGDTGWVAK